MTGMKESDSEDVATHTGPESCATVREDRMDLWSWVVKR
jgi:hypothetical protein